jgi:hypothetical protein
VTPLLEEALAAYGGLERWRDVFEISAHARSGGLALGSKLAGRPFRDYHMTVFARRPRTVISPYPRAGSRGVFDEGSVRIESERGGTIAVRENPRPSFARGRRLFWWDRLDALYFAGYALWNYFTLPYLLASDGVEVGEEGRTLHASFPPGLHTHSREQAFHLDEQGLIAQHDYTPEVFGGWAKAAHVTLAHEQVDGLTFHTKRRVTPRTRSGKPRRGPVLVWLEFDRLEVSRA